jgi:hypothetical protein
VALLRKHYQNDPRILEALDWAELPMALQRPLPDEMLRVVAAGDKTDGTLSA